MSNIIAIVAPISAIIALIFAYGLTAWIVKMDEGTERMKEITSYIREGSMAFLKREYQTMFVVIAVLFLLIGLTVGWMTASLYLLGSLLSVLAGFFGMHVATKGNVRTAQAAQDGGMNKALKVVQIWCCYGALCNRFRPIGNWNYLRNNGH